MDKAALISAVIGNLESTRAVLMAAAHSSKDEATDQESRQEGKYDMRAQSAAYVAEGQGRLVAELTEAIAAYHNLARTQGAGGGVVATGSIVTLEARGERTVYFIGPARGGIDIVLAGVTVTVITAFSPLGRRLLGRKAGDSIGPADARGGQDQIVSKIE